MEKPTVHVVTVKTVTVLKIIAIFLALWLLWVIRDILALLAVALFLSALMHPAARWGERYKIPKGVTVILIYVFLFILLALVFAMIIPALFDQLGSLSQSIGSSLVTISSSVQSLREFIQHYGLANNLSAGVASIQDQLSQAAGGFFSVLTNIFGGLAGLAVVLVMAFYMVSQENNAVRIFRNIVPEPYQEKSAQILVQVEEKIGHWLSGQLALSFLIGVLYYIGLLILGINSPLALAIFAGFTEFVPYLGPILGGIPIVIVAFSESPVKALFALGLTVIIQQLENQIIVPKVMQKATGLNPLISIIALLVGAKLFGVVGALLSIPVATALSVILTELYRYRQEQT